MTTLRTVFDNNGRMRVSDFFHSGLANEKSRASALAQKNVRTIAMQEMANSRLKCNTCSNPLAAMDLRLSL